MNVAWYRRPRGVLREKMAWDLRATYLYSQIGSVLDEPIGDLNYFDRRHEKAQRQPKSRGQHLVGKYANVLGIVLKLRYVGCAVRRSKQVGLRSSPEPA